MQTVTVVKEIPLLEERPLAKLIAYVAGTSSEMPFNDRRKAVLIIPGGAYWLQSDAEADPIAHYYLAMGFNAFVLRYSVGRGVDSVWPKPLMEASAAMKYIRDHAEELHIDPNYVFAVGFSAGGHLAAMVSNMPDSEISRPNATILSYSVLSSKKSIRHPGSFLHLLGDVPEEEYDKFSMPECATESTPPAFIWHTMPDSTVPVQNSVEYALALKKLNIDAELHLYPHGPHGLGTGERPEHAGRFSEVRAWTKLAQRFLKDRNW